jgi:phosphomannomutase
MRISVEQLMDESGVRFGTSGARGRAADMTDRLCYIYTKGFLQHLEASRDGPDRWVEVAVAGDLRPSTGRIMEAVCRAIEDCGYTPVNCGRIPSPAIALYGLTKGIPAVMVTGSHIPGDRNGIKFNKCSGEILKEDEAAIRRQTVDYPETLFDASGAFVLKPAVQRQVHTEAEEAYVARYLDVFPSAGLKGQRIGVYQHSAVGRELLLRILAGLGAEAIPLGLADEFVPVDTEAIRPEDVCLAKEWARQYRFDALVSTDGDGDRPLIGDECGNWLRGDIAGLLCARFLEADSVSTPVSCNTAVERCGWFAEVRRTRIGSPYVIASMLDASARGARRVVGYEANGGFLTNSHLQIGQRTLRALPTRDAVLPIACILLLAARERTTISQLLSGLPPRYTASDRLKDFPTSRSRAILDRFTTGNELSDKCALEALFGTECGRVTTVDRTDGIRAAFENGEIIHLRPSGNAPEFRCYIEAASAERAAHLNAWCLELLRKLSL